MQVHSAGYCICYPIIIGDISIHDEYQTSRQLLLQGEKNMAVVNVVNADVLPSFSEGERIRLQMIAFALDIHYYETEEKYYASLENNYALADGCIFPVGIFNDEKNGKKKDIPRDYSLLRATVKEVNYGFHDNGEEKIPGYICTRVYTGFGEIEIVHSLEQIDESEREIIKPGSTVSGLFIFSGDAAIFEYDNGIIKDKEHNLRLLQYIFAKGDPTRLQRVLAEDAIYYSEVTGKKFVGKNNIIDQIKYVKEVTTIKYFPHMATILQPIEDSLENSSLEYGEGERCVVLAEDEEENYQAIAFIDLDEENNISRLYISKGAGYTFTINSYPLYNTFEDEK